MNYQVVPVFRKVKQFSHCVPYNSFKRENHKINIFFLQQSHNGLSSLVDDQPVSSNLKKACYYFKKKKKAFSFVCKTYTFSEICFLRSVCYKLPIFLPIANMTCTISENQIKLAFCWASKTRSQEMDIHFYIRFL